MQFKELPQGAYFVLARSSLEETIAPTNPVFFKVDHTHVMSNKELSLRNESPLTIPLLDSAVVFATDADGRLLSQGRASPSIEVDGNPVATLIQALTCYVRGDDVGLERGAFLVTVADRIRQDLLDGKFEGGPHATKVQHTMGQAREPRSMPSPIATGKVLKALRQVRKCNPDITKVGYDTGGTYRFFDINGATVEAQPGTVRFSLHHEAVNETMARGDVTLPMVFSLPEDELLPQWVNEPQTPPILHVVATGNPFDGLKLYGPFVDHETAREYAERLAGDWNIADLEAP